MGNKNILIICTANYCRSPVAANILQNRLGSSFKIDSAGLIQFDIPGMDPRSLKYLTNIGLKTNLHQPKIITKQLVKNADLIYAIDSMILMQLNNKFHNYNYKFKLFSLINENIILRDPYKMDDKSYIKIMENISYVSSKITID